MKRDPAAWDDWEVRWMERTIGQVRGLVALDIGAGDGQFMEALRARGVRPYGIDAAPRHPLVSQAVFPDLTRVTALPASFDLLCCREVSYLLDLDTVLSACWRLVKPGGWLHLKASCGPAREGWNHTPSLRSYGAALVRAGFAPGAHRFYPRGWRPWRYPRRFLLLARAGARRDASGQGAPCP